MMGDRSATLASAVRLSPTANKASMPMRLLAVALLAVATRLVLAAPEPPCDGAEPTARTVVRVVDGDTIVLDHQEKVRLIGVDTPETVDPRKPVQYFGHEASAFTTQRLQGKQVHLAYDWQRTDKYRRTLAYVCLEGELVNETIIREGYGVALTKYPFNADVMARFRAAEADARARRHGLWAASR
jgi:micrococcal nuclease